MHYGIQPGFWGGYGYEAWWQVAPYFYYPWNLCTFKPLDDDELTIAFDEFGEEIDIYLPLEKFIRKCVSLWSA